MIDYKMLTGADLAFIGDAYFELCIRHYVLKCGYTDLKELHDHCVKFVSRDNQAYIIDCLSNIMTEEEQNIYKRGRNYNYKTKTADYIKASGFEAVIGYLYLSENFSRLDEIISLSIKFIEEKND